MLKLQQVFAGYKNSEVLHGVDLQLEAGEVVTLLGRNGMGKSTTIKCICGLLGISTGTIEINGRRTDQLASYQIARLGVGLVPEERHIFPNLNVRENLIPPGCNCCDLANGCGSSDGTCDSDLVVVVLFLFHKLTTRGY